MGDPDTIVAISTPLGEGGVGLVRISGPKALSIGRALFHSRPVLGTRIRRVEYGRIQVDGLDMDTALAWVLQAPHSYTGEDTVEISCHGSVLLLELLVQAALAKGAVAAGPGEFTRRAFLNGRLDLLQAEAVVDLIQADSKANLSTAYGHLNGLLSDRVNALKARIVKVLSLLEIGLDFSEEDLGVIARREVVDELHHSFQDAQLLADTFAGSRRRQGGLLVAIIGNPNVGKSTLLNALLGEERAIVTPIPGTTRDLVEGRVVWGGELIRLVDTAGLRSEAGPIEKEGIQRAVATAEKADFVLIVVDASRPWEDEQTLFDSLRGKTGLVVHNKSDLPKALQLPKGGLLDLPNTEISATTGAGLAILREQILSLMPRNALPDGGVSLTRQRHMESLQTALDHIEKALDMAHNKELDECIAAELQEVLWSLGEMLGEQVSEEVLDRIFADFCIGK